MCLRFPALLACLVAFVPAASAGSSNSLLDVSPDSKRLLAANSDNDSVSVLDVQAGKTVREIAVGRKPEGVTWIGNGPLAAATTYVGREVVIFNVDDGKIVRRIPVAAEPYGIVGDKAGKRLWVTHEYPGLVSEIDPAAGTVLRTIPAGRMIRGIALAPDENRVYVTEFNTGILRAIDLASGAVVDSWTGHTTDNLARHVILHPTRPKAYIAHQRSIVKVNDGDGSIFPQLSVCDLKPAKSEDAKRRTSFAMDTFNGVYVVTNPLGDRPVAQRQATLRHLRRHQRHEPLRRHRRRLLRDRPRRPGGATRPDPRAIRVSPDNKAVYVYNALEFAVAVHDPATMALVKKIKTCEPPKSPEWVRGKVLFNTSQPPMSARRWIACSSCHPDGHTDARVWQQPEGLRKTTAMFGVAHTHPLHYSADRDEVQDFEFTIRSKLMRGPGLMRGPLPPKLGYHKVELEVTTAGKSKDLDALAIYTNSFDFELSPHIDAPGQAFGAGAARQAIFFDKSVGCATCHSGPYYTDSSLVKPYKLHDVGTGSDDLSERMGPEYDTPTLLGVYRTAPYLHHGKATTLAEVFTKYNAADKHGRTSQLSPPQIDDLGRVPEGAALRDAAGRDAEHGAVSVCCSEEVSDRARSASKASHASIILATTGDLPCLRWGLGRMKDTDELRPPLPLRTRDRRRPEGRRSRARLLFARPRRPAEGRRESRHHRRPERGETAPRDAARPLPQRRLPRRGVRRHARRFRISLDHRSDRRHPQLRPRLAALGHARRPRTSRRARGRHRLCAGAQAALPGPARRRRLQGRSPNPRLVDRSARQGSSLLFEPGMVPQGGSGKGDSGAVPQDRTPSAASATSTASC